MQGGSISLTNPGGLGATFLTPIINSIVGLGTVRSAPPANPEPSIGPVAQRDWLPLIVSFDHRINDGADAARFTHRTGQLLERPEEMLFAAWWRKAHSGTQIALLPANANAALSGK